MVKEEKIFRIKYCQYSDRYCNCWFWLCQFIKSVKKDNFMKVDKLIVFFLYVIYYSFVNTGFLGTVSVNLRGLWQILLQWNSCQLRENLRELQRNSLKFFLLTYDCMQQSSWIHLWHLPIGETLVTLASMLFLFTQFIILILN